MVFNINEDGNVLRGDPVEWTLNMNCVRVCQVSFVCLLVCFSVFLSVWVPVWLSICVVLCVCLSFSLSTCRDQISDLFSFFHLRKFQNNTEKYRYKEIKQYYQMRMPSKTQGVSTGSTHRLHNYLQKRYGIKSKI